jgi:hypothetical protein
MSYSLAGGLRLRFILCAKCFRAILFFPNVADNLTTVLKLFYSTFVKQKVTQNSGLGRSITRSREDSSDGVLLQSGFERNLTPESGSVFSDAQSSSDILDDLGSDCQERSSPIQEINSENIKLISSGRFKLDFEPSYDVEREVEIKKALKRKIEKEKIAKELTLR